MKTPVTRDVAVALCDLTVILRDLSNGEAWDRAGILNQSHLAARGEIDAFDHCIAMLVAAKRAQNLTPSSVNFSSSQQHDIDCDKPGHEHAGYRLGFGCAACWTDVTAEADAYQPERREPPDRSELINGIRSSIRSAT